MVRAGIPRMNETPGNRSGGSPARVSRVTQHLKQLRARKVINRSNCFGDSKGAGFPMGRTEKISHWSWPETEATRRPSTTLLRRVHSNH